MFEQDADQAIRAWEALSPAQRADALQAASRRQPTPDPRIAPTVVAYARVMYSRVHHGGDLVLTGVSLLVVLAIMGLLAIGAPQWVAVVGIFAVIVGGIAFGTRNLRRRGTYRRLMRSGIDAIKARR